VTTIDAPLPPRGAHSGPVTRLVVHCMGELIRNTDPQFPVGTIPAWDWLKALGLSAHALITPDGTVVRCVPSSQRAYHAKGFNDRSVGVELLVPGAHDEATLARTVGWDLKAWAPAATRPTDPYTEAQYDALRWWLRAEREAAASAGHPALTRHDVLSPERKFDPGPVFDWTRVLAAYELDADLGPPV
jgi:N-acetylmuramoyl-L-alanine amidase